MLNDILECEVKNPSYNIFSKNKRYEGVGNWIFSEVNKLACNESNVDEQLVQRSFWMNNLIMICYG